MIIKYSRDAIKFLERQPKKTVERVRQAIGKLALFPPEGDISLLRGYADGRMRLRVGSLRVIYRRIMEGQIEIILIIDIGSRGGIYK